MLWSRHNFGAPLLLPKQQCRGMASPSFERCNTKRARLCTVAAAAHEHHVRIVVVGDVHNQYSHTLDTAALHALNPDVTVFVGDLANEDVEIVRTVAQCPLRKVVVLGNHDAWFSLTARGRSRFARSFATSSFTSMLSQDRIGDMLRVLGEDHIGYDARVFSDDLGLAFVGARPFSRGGEDWEQVADFYNDRFGVKNFEESAARIAALIDAQPADMPVIVVGHCGPTGLGSMPQSICGADFLPAAGDWGDPDLALALQKVLAPQENSTGTPDGQVGKHTPTPTAATRDAVSMLPKVHTECNTVPVLASRPVLRPAAAAKTVASEQPTVRGAVSSVVSPREASSSSTQNNTNTTHTPLSRSTQRNLPSKSPHLRVPLVLFGHMHERLCATGAHTAKTGLRDMVVADPGTGTVYVNAAVVPRVVAAPDSNATRRHFCVVDMEGGVVSRVAHVWVEVGAGKTPQVAQETVVCKRVAADAAQQVCYSVLYGSRNEWGIVTCRVGEEKS